MATIRTLATFAAVFAAGSALVDTVAGACDPRSLCPTSAAQSAGESGSAFDLMKALFEAPTPAKRNAASAKPEPARARMATSALRQSGKRTQKPLLFFFKNYVPPAHPPLSPPARPTD